MKEREEHLFRLSGTHVPPREEHLFHRIIIVYRGGIEESIHTPGNGILYKRMIQ